jgi:hypothetical protein
MCFDFLLGFCAHFPHVAGTSYSLYKPDNRKFTASFDLNKLPLSQK